MLTVTITTNTETLTGEIHTSTDVLTADISQLGTPGLNNYELAQMFKGFTGTVQEFLDSQVGPPVPVADVLGQSSELAVSQKLLTDTVDVMQADSATAVTEANRLNALAQAAVTEATRQADLITADAAQTALDRIATNAAAVDTAAARDRSVSIEANITNLFGDLTAVDEAVLLTYVNRVIMDTALTNNLIILLPRP